MIKEPCRIEADGGECPACSGELDASGLDPRHAHRPAVPRVGWMAVAGFLTVTLLLILVLAL